MSYACLQIIFYSYILQIWKGLASNRITMLIAGMRSYLSLSTLLLELKGNILSPMTLVDIGKELKF